MTSLLPSVEANLCPPPALVAGLLPAPGETSFVPPTSNIFWIPPQLPAWTLDQTLLMHDDEREIALEYIWSARYERARARHWVDPIEVIAGQPPKGIVVQKALL